MPEETVKIASTNAAGYVLKSRSEIEPGDTKYRTPPKAKADKSKADKPKGPGVTK
ncbi:MAG: hypothetical protein JRC86_00385 [Deltaproteobacteria bacterium]|nr:hypothetical protein [Deltaproteobacteria bacterium]